MSLPPPPTAAPPAPPSPPPDTADARSFWWRACRCTHSALRCAWALAVLFAGPLLYLWIVGLPALIANRLLRHVDSRPYEITAERIGISPRGFILLHGVFIYPEGNYSEPLVRLGTLSIQPRFSALLRGRLEPRNAVIQEGFVLLPAWAREATRRADHRVVLTNLQVAVSWRNDHFSIDRAEAYCHALRISCSGALTRAKTENAEYRLWAEIARAIEGFRHNRSLLPTLVNALADMRADEPPRLAIALSGAATAVCAAVELDSGPFTLHQQRIDRIRGRAFWTPAYFHLESFRVEGPNRVMMEVRADPGPPVWVPANLSGFFAYDRLSLRGVPLAQGSGRIASADGVLLLYEVATRIGAAGERGEAALELAWDPAQHVTEGALALRLDPNDFAPILNSNQLRLARRFVFSNELPRFTGRFRRTTVPTNLYVEGELTASNFSYRGVHVDSMRAVLVHTNHHVRLDPWHFDRPEGSTTGWIDVPLSDRAIRVALDSTMHPAAIAGIIGPRLHRTISSWRFDGPVALRARGVVDATGHEEITDLMLEVAGQKMGRGRWIADEASFRLHALHGAYTTTDAVGRAYNGQWRAAVRVEPMPAGPEHRFIIDAAITNADFAKIAEGALSASDQAPSGRVHLDMQITGLVSDAFGAATRGGGSLVIEDGAILRTRLFGGLSDLLSRLVPGLGFIAQTDLTCTYQIADGAIFSDDILLSGDLISMRADGEMEFNGEIRMRVEVQLLRRGPIAFLLRLVTLPVTKLFEFRLTGTLENPKWRPVNLPKELFLIFD